MEFHLLRMCLYGKIPALSTARCALFHTCETSSLQIRAIPPDDSPDLLVVWPVARVRAIVRITLLDMVRKPPSRPYHDPDMPLRVVTGMGRNSKDGEAVIKVRAMSDESMEEHPLPSPLRCRVIPFDLSARACSVGGHLYPYNRSRFAFPSFLSRIGL